MCLHGRLRRAAIPAAVGPMTAKWQLSPPHGGVPILCRLWRYGGEGQRKRRELDAGQVFGQARAEIFIFQSIGPACGTKVGRGDWIRTSDPLRPRQVRYQAALRPDFPKKTR